jgi:quercetin dioxygenase-like cupin family protein
VNPAAERSVRRVVTADTPEGRSVVVSDDEVAPVPPRVGVVIHPVWGSDRPMTLPADGTHPAADGQAPPAGGVRFTLVTFAANEEVLGGGFHRSDTVDLCFVVSGELWIELDDGAEVLLRTGDTLVQHGTVHAWHNRGDAPCTMAIAAVGAERRIPPID